MAEEGFKRKLTAILSADVVGYSLLMENNEEATIQTLNTYRNSMSNLIQQYRGRVVDTTGDNLLAEFTSAVDAVNCAVEIQRDLAERNAELTYERKMEFRIGVNVGDVVEEEDRIYGEGVNIAARVESMADAGGICISGRTYDQVANKLDLEYENLGEHQVKNISTPIRVYRVLSYPGAAAHRVIQAKETLGRKRRNIAILAAVVVVIAVGLGIWQFYMRRPTVEPASVEKMAFALPDKPSIAVLAFDNLSGDPEQEYFSDGIAENIITALSKVGELFVIARNSSFTYKGKPVKVQQISQELGIRYVLEGSVRKSGDRVRITAQLIDAINGQHLWAENYDRNLEDIFEIQDEITMKIVTGMRVNLTEGEQARLFEKQTNNLDVFLKYTQFLSLSRVGTKESLNRRGQIAKEIIDIEPDNPLGYRLMGWYHHNLVDFGVSPKENLEKALMFGKKALEMDESDGFSHSLLGSIYNKMGKLEKAIESGKRSVELQPNGDLVHNVYAITLDCAGHDDEAIAYSRRSIRLNPFPPHWYYQILGRAYGKKGEYENALKEFKKALQRAPESPWSHLDLALIYSFLGRDEEARASAAKCMELAPYITVGMFSEPSPCKGDKAFVNKLRDSMRKAGFPE
jgi:TolB-like protein/class 3 adenylate cyclase